MDYEPQGSYCLRSDLITRLQRLGANVIPLFYYQDDLRGALENSDGLLIPGSRYDISPARYGQETKFSSVKTNETRENFEWKLLEVALQLDLPLLGICWGLQLLNVYLGGSLFQDLPQEFSSNLQHEQKTPSTNPVHEVVLTKNGLAENLWKTQRLNVNSTHHQGIDRLGKGLIVEACAPDGLVECIRLEGKNFVWGVEWHPERLSDDPVIPSFLAACRR